MVASRFRIMSYYAAAKLWLCVPCRRGAVVYCAVNSNASLRMFVRVCWKLRRKSRESVCAVIVLKVVVPSNKEILYRSFGASSVQKPVIELFKYKGEES
jgi:hypothetical protein